MGPHLWKFQPKDIFLQDSLGIEFYEASFKYSIRWKNKPKPGFNNNLLFTYKTKIFIGLTRFSVIIKMSWLDGVLDILRNYR